MRARFLLGVLRSILGRAAWLPSLVALACSEPGAAPSVEHANNVGVELIVDAGEIDEVQYEVTGNGITPLEGTIDVSGSSSAPPVLAFSLPVGSGYLIELTGVSHDGTMDCSGSQSFAVTALEPTSVEVDLECKVRDHGGVDVGVGALNVCPEITLLRLSSSPVFVLYTTTLHAQATDLDGDPLVYSYSATAGTFESQSGADAAYRCPRVGSNHITVSVSDGKCGDQFTLPIECVVSPFCGNGTLDPREPCDDGNRIGGDGCAADCSKVEVCGDAFLDEGEVCDDGNAGGCRADCRRCGDGVAQAAFEQCDDGNTVNEDACTNSCSLPRCGDAICSVSESCLACESDCGVCTAGEIQAIFADPHNFTSIKSALAFQTASASFDFSSESIKLRYASWSDDPAVIPNRADLADALGEAWDWILGTDPFGQLGQPATALTSAGNGGPTAANPSSFPEYHVPLDHAWQLYVWWVAHDIVLEMRGELPWSLEELGGKSGDPLAALFDSTEMMHRGATDVAFGEPPGFGYLGHPYASYLGATVIGTPRYTFRFLSENGLVRPTRRETIAAVLDWVSDHLVRFDGLANRVTAQDHWGHPYDPSVEKLVEGTVRASDHAFGRYTLDCFGTAELVKDVLRAVNIPARVPLNCQHAQLWFPADDLFVTHAQDAYDPAFKASACTGDDLLLDQVTWESLLGTAKTNRFPSNCASILPYSVSPSALAACH